MIVAFCSVKRKILLFITGVFMLHFQLSAQHLHPGFSKHEYIELLKITTRFADSIYFDKMGDPEKFHFVYRSPVVGLDNQWDLWTSNDSLAAISIRGSTSNSISWVANFYAAMVPAQGTLHLSASDSFQYKLAADPQAAVHIGWLVSTAFLAKDILPRIDSCYRSGVREFFIIGHSQGGAISYLLTSYLYHLQLDGGLPKDIRFKTYSSASPKPGNLYYAYDYEALTYPGWAYNVVNKLDWVPETPISIQTLNDFNKANPFAGIRELIKKQKFPQNLAFRYVYNRLDKPTRRAQRNYEKYLGKMTSKMVKKHLPEFKFPLYYKSNGYVRVGNSIVLVGDAAYFELYPDDPQRIFIHHLILPYRDLAERLPE